MKAKNGARMLLSQGTPQIKEKEKKGTNSFSLMSLESMHDCQHLDFGSIWFFARVSARFDLQMLSTTVSPPQAQN